ncbi:MAG: twin-arginine translocase subunit TatC [Planctomycetota bacterium]
MKPPCDTGGGRMSLAGHLEELRRRVVVCLLAFGSGTAVAFWQKEALFAWVTRPHAQAMRRAGLAPVLVFLGPADKFLGYFKICLLAGFVLVSPVVLFEMWRFIASALHPHERRFIGWALPVSVVLFAGGVVFAWAVALPYGLAFLYGFGGSDLLQPAVALGQYLGFAIPLLAISGAVAELPLVMAFLAATGVAGAADFAAWRKPVILGIFIAAAVLTPQPDAVSQCLLAVPMLALYETGILAARVMAWRRAGREAV